MLATRVAQPYAALQYDCHSGVLSSRQLSASSAPHHLPDAISPCARAPIAAARLHASVRRNRCGQFLCSKDVGFRVSSAQVAVRGVELRRRFAESWDVNGHLGGARSFRTLQETALERRRASASGQARASLLGVGAPEALVIAVVALLVFGPKGLAEVARNLGKTLKAFQPTIRELQDVSREFRSTLEQEIGLDELRQPYRAPPTALPPSTPSTSLPSSPPSAPTKDGDSSVGTSASLPKELSAYSAEDYARVTEEQARSLVSEDMRKAAAAAAWGGAPPPPRPQGGAAPATELGTQPPAAAGAITKEATESSKVGGDAPRQ